jgi:hypothetical protein
LLTGLFPGLPAGEAGLNLTFRTGTVRIDSKTIAVVMTMLEPALDRLAERILGLDEASLSSLWEKYKNRMERFEPSKEWEKSVIIFFIINAVRAKNHIFNQQLIRQRETGPERTPKGGKPDLRRVK